MVARVEAQNEELRTLLGERGVTRQLVERLLGEWISQEAKNLNKSLDQVRESKTHIKRLEIEHELGTHGYPAWR